MIRTKYVSVLAGQGRRHCVPPWRQNGGPHASFASKLPPPTEGSRWHSLEELQVRAATRAARVICLDSCFPFAPCSIAPARTGPGSWIPDIHIHWPIVVDSINKCGVCAVSASSRVLPQDSSIARSSGGVRQAQRADRNEERPLPPIGRIPSRGTSGTLSPPPLLIPLGSKVGGTTSLLFGETDLHIYRVPVRQTRRLVCPAVLA